MSNYSKTTDFEAKDSLPTGDSGKIIRGAEFETEFDAISTAIATKADTAGPTFTGTLTFETISDGTIGITAFVDEDNMASNSATLVPTQQSVKAYVDSVTTELEAQDLDFQADSGGALSIDLDTETMTFTGGTGITTTGLANDVTFAIDSTVATLTGTQTLTNKTLTSPDVDTPDIDGGTIDGTVIGGTTPAAVSATTVSATGNITVDGTVDGRDVATDGTKLDGIEAGATADQTAAEIRTLVDSATDSNVFTDADHTKLDGIEANATADQTDAEIRAAVEAATDSNVFTDADHTKLDGIEAGADVTDTTNVTAAGALMDSELTDITAVKSLDQGVATTDSPTFAGLTTTADVSFGDNDKAIFGAGSDLQIYHDGSHSYVKDNGTGNLRLQGSTTVQITDPSFTSYSAQFNPTGAATLYHNNSAKLATTATGIDVTGTVTADGLTVDGNAVVTNATNATLQLQATGGNAYQLRTDVNDVFIYNATGARPLAKFAYGGDISFYEDTGTTAKLFWDASAESLGIGTTTPNHDLDIEISETATYSSSASVAPDVSLRIVNDDTTTANTMAMMSFASKGTTSTQSLWYMGNVGMNNAYADSSFIFGHRTGGSGWNEVMRLDGSGNVGIGTSPAQKLHVVGTSRPALIGSDNAVNIVKLYNSATGSGSYNGLDLLVNSTSNTQIKSYGMPLTFGTSASNGTDVTERMRIDSSGVVGINTTASNQFDGTPSLIVGSGSGDSGIAIYTGSSSAGYLQFGDGTSGAEEYRGFIKYDHSANSMSFNTNSTGRSEAKMTLDGSGNLLVGTTSTATNDVGFKVFQSTGQTVTTASGTNPVLFNRKTSDGDIAVFRKDDTTVGSIGTFTGYTTIGGNTNGGLIFRNGEVLPWNNSGGDYSNGGIDLGDGAARFKDLYLSGGLRGDTTFKNNAGTTEYARFDSSGNLLVGTTDFPTDDNTALSFGVKSNGETRVSANNIPALHLKRASSDGDILVFRKDSATAVGSISVTTSATSYNTSSDQRLKENIVDAPSASDDIDAIQVRSFDWKADGSHQKYGMVAQELQSVAPEAVTGDANPDDMMGVDYSKLVPMMLKEIQSLRARVAQLEGEN